MWTCRTSEIFVGPIIAKLSISSVLPFPLDGLSMPNHMYSFISTIVFRLRLEEASPNSPALKTSQRMNHGFSAETDIFTNRYMVKHYEKIIPDYGRLVDSFIRFRGKRPYRCL